MKRLALVGLRPCPGCGRAVAHLMTEDREQTLRIALDASEVRELSRGHGEPGEQRFLTDLLVQLLASSSYAPRHVVLDWEGEGLFSARVDLTTEIFRCSLQEGLGFAVGANIPLYATERILNLKHPFHPPETGAESTDLVQLKPKPMLH